MTYSFTKPQKRPLFSLLDRIWIVLFGFAFVFIFFVFVIYEFRIIFTHNAIDNKKEEVILTTQQIKKNEELYLVLLKQSQIAAEFKDKNQNTKDSLKNLFDMTLKTGSISFDSVEQSATMLKLTGVSPTKEMFALLLETPLKSIFDETNTSYYELDNGWYRFVSISKILGMSYER
ncbi:hypothetical protein [Campylobacter helveticus]|uniref:Uncharacterized protein n=1 Tax=Campylobacter helveticus TaxID=28898 RepID=A0AAX2UJH1_9BACT|nr:hypothetical protein [Campylobacter helveticus]ARE80425.1 hypothetical protein CHELV3228_0830 [Campylobacter helveticus]MCR2039650.1 hypothetical protein [Campylobacter helveticus]MCR2054306.1 hypothetical protein [Campylobacter helveticus]MCR2066426.1 hypothetical protein [Campylobacter helveticus]TNB56495.1 hypothetical protein FDW42_07335 [Campylobacter helveticus]